MVEIGKTERPFKIFDISPLETQTLATDVCTLLDKDLSKVKVEKFADGETDVDIQESVRGQNVYVFQSYIPPLGERLYELRLFISAAKRGGNAKRVRVIMPHLFGCRGERRVRPRQAIQALDVAKGIHSSGGEGVLTLGEHSPALGSIYEAVGLEYENLKLESIAANYEVNHANAGNCAIVSPDLGGGIRAEEIASIVERETGEEIELVLGRKTRPRANVVDKVRLIGDISGKDAEIIDDIVDTVGTIKKTSQECRKEGAVSVRAVFYHAVFGEGYEEKLIRMLGGKEPLVNEIVVFDTIPLKPAAAEHPRIRIIPTAPLIAEAVSRINSNTSISSLHRYKPVMEVYDAANKRGNLSYLDNPKYVRIESK